VLSVNTHRLTPRLPAEMSSRHAVLGVHVSSSPWSNDKPNLIGTSTKNGQIEVYVRDLYT